jgi:hypothetical protein
VRIFDCIKLSCQAKKRTALHFPQLRLPHVTCAVGRFWKASTLCLARIGDSSHAALGILDGCFGSAGLISATEVSFWLVRLGRHLFLPVEVRLALGLEESQGFEAFE